MRTDPHLDPEENALAQMGYETEDVEFKSLGRSIGFFFAFVVFCGVAGAIIFFLFMGGGVSGAIELAKSGPASDTAPFVRRLPAEGNPLLQTNITARTDIRDLRREESLLLHGKPTWVDQTKGSVRIPIDQAIDEYLQKRGSSATQPTTIVSGAPPVSAEPPREEAGAATPSPHP